MGPVLETRGLVKKFGSFVATNGVDLCIQAGARHALIGPNGAGKTTLINLLTGFLEPTAGEVLLNGQTVTRLRQHRRVQLGLVRTFQINRLFAELSVFESVLMAVNERRGLGGQFWRACSEFGEAVEETTKLLEQLHLRDVAHERTRSVAYGKQRLLEIALALAVRPRVLLLDEPAAGVPTSESRELFETIARLPREVTILLIEHDMDLVFRFAERISVLVNGAVLREDIPQVIARDPKVKEVYLGEAISE
ncbi:MAG TPA: ABC transporter ATP-binding protein [Burkholderiaceae bacterium]|nr:ABC transporter ATP-binding protein [Burkholderiaceae bacterium]